MAELESSFKLQDRTAILTGPCSTFNQAIATRFTQMGANVALIDRNSERSQRFAEQLMNAREINDRYGRAVAIQADLTKAHHAQDAITRAAEAFGGIDIYVDGLIINEVKSFKDPKIFEDFDRILDVNLRTPLLLTHGVLRFLENRKRGRIIYLLHDVTRVGLPMNGLLAATRNGLIHFSKSLASELRDSSVTVNCVGLGLTEELLLAQSTEASSVQAAQTKLRTQFPHAQLTDPERIANLVVFLASPLASGITGQTIAASDGLSMIS